MSPRLVETIVRVAVVQTDPLLGDVAANLEGIRAGISTAAADLVVLPECALSGYGFASRADALDVAQPVPGDATEEIVEVCARTRSHAIVGLLERDGDRLFNSAVLVGPEGVAGVYRKVHLPFLGVDRFATPGDKGFPLFVTPVGRIGILICYDLSFPEAARVLKLDGAQIVCVPTNWPMAAEVSCLHAPLVRAQENHVHVVTADRVGEEAGFCFRGKSRIVDCDGAILAEAGTGPEIIRAELDLDAADRNHVVIEPGRYELDRIAHRRPEFYGPIAAPAVTIRAPTNAPSPQPPP